MSRKPCLTLSCPSGADTLSIPAELPEWLSVHIFVPGEGVQMRHVLVTERSPDAARACESYQFDLDDISDSAERTAVLEAAADAMEHILTGLLPVQGPELPVSHSGYGEPAHRRMLAIRELAKMAEHEADLCGSATDVSWAMGGVVPMWTTSGVAGKMLDGWIAHLADEATIASHDRATRAAAIWEANNEPSNDTASDAADCGMGYFQ
jgi:hypothetical protein